MLTKDTIKKLKGFGFDVEALIAAAKDEAEVSITVPELVTEAQLTERDTHTIAAVRDGIFKEGKTAGLDIAGKAIAKKYGLTDITEFGDPTKVIAALDSVVVKGDAGLKTQIEALIKDKDTLSATILQREGDLKSAKFDTDLITHFPTGRTGMTDREFLALAKMNMEFEDVDGKTVVKRDGEVLRHKTTQAPVPIKDAISQLFADKKWIAEDKGSGGRGGGDDSGGGASGIKTYSQAEAAWLKSNPNGNLMGTEFQSHIQKLAKEPDFNMDV